MHFQEIRRAATQGTISLPPPRDSEGLEDISVLKSCLKVTRDISNFRYAFAKDQMSSTWAHLMGVVEAKKELSRQQIDVALRPYFLSLILNSVENRDIVLLGEYVHALFESSQNAAAAPVNVKTVVAAANCFAQENINWRQDAISEEERPLITPNAFQDSHAIQLKLARWEAYSKDLRDQDPLVHALLTNLYFMAISPLNRNNGRVTQILLQAALMGNAIQSPAPCLQLGKAFSTNAHLGIEERLYALRTRRWSPYLIYMLRTISKAVAYSIELFSALQRLYSQTEFYLNRIGLPNHTAFLPVIFKHPACRTGEFSSICTTRRQVASHVLNDLTRAGILERTEDGRDRVFYNKRLFELLESDNYSFTPYPASLDPFVPLYQKGTPGRAKKENTPA